MKIVNSKGLMRYANSGGLPDKAGFLLKRGDLNKGYQRRWFILKGNLLFYYEKRHDKEPVGVIVLEGCCVEVSDREGVTNFAFQITFPGSAGRTYILSADSQEDMEGWMKSLSCAPYDYIKLVVLELENQLREKHSADHARLVQAADRDSRIFGRAYSEDLSQRKPARPPRPAGKVGRVTFPFSGSEDWKAGGLQDSGQNHLTDFGGKGSFDFVSFDHFDSSASACVRVTTWKRLGISTFYAMHDEIKRQIKEFSSPPCVSQDAGSATTTQ